MTYFDTGYVVKCYVPEPGSAEVRSLAAQAEHVACSEFGRMELHAALHRKLREGALSRTDLDVVFRQIDLDERERLWAWLPLTERIMADVAATFRALPAAVFLRTGDAVHLATAKAYSFTELWSSDVRLVAAAAHFGIAGRSLATHPPT